jgi:alpha-glucosidase/alpha-D-xyloside xylohydrolase
MRAATVMLAILGLANLVSVGVLAQANGFVVDRENRTIVVEPYGPNIVRITLSSEKPAALAAPGYGITGTPSMTGWTQTQDSDGYDVIRSGRMIVRFAPQNLLIPHRMPLDALNESLREHYFGGGPPSGHGPYNDAISVATVSGKPLLTMRRWTMFPNRPEATTANASHEQEADPGYRVSATFDSPDGEHYYGLGQHQQGFLDLRDHRIQ